MRRPWQFRLFIVGQLLLGALYLTLAIALAAIGIGAALLTGARCPPIGAAMIIAAGYLWCRKTDRRAVRKRR